MEGEKKRENLNTTILASEGGEGVIPYLLNKFYIFLVTNSISNAAYCPSLLRVFSASSLFTLTIIWKEGGRSVVTV